MNTIQMNRRKGIIELIVLVAFVCALIYAKIANAEEAPPSPFQKGAFTVNPFASARIVDSKVEYGAGISAGYALFERFTIEGEAMGEEIDDSNWLDLIKEVGGNAKFYFPIKHTGFAPYLIGGYSRDLHQHENRLNAGAGAEYRRGRFIAFADARLDHGFEQELAELGNHVKVRAGVGWRF